MRKTKKFKILEVSLRLDGRVYAGEEKAYTCYGDSSEGHTHGIMVPMINRDFEGSFCVRCTKHVDELLEEDGWKVYTGEE